MEKQIWKDIDGYAIEIFRKGNELILRVTSSSAPDKPIDHRIGEFGGDYEYVSTIHADLPEMHRKGLQKLGVNSRNYRMIGPAVFRASGEQFVMQVRQQLETQFEERRQTALEILERNVPGLRELRVAWKDERRYQRQFNRMMEDENNDGARPPKPVKASVEQLTKLYPVAAAYLTAESWSMASHDAKASAGRKAKKRIASGEDYVTVMTEMDAEWSEYCRVHAWD